MNTLPPESITHISTYLPSSTCIRNRAVCKSWQRDTSRHCGYFLIHDRSRSCASFSAHITSKAEENTSSGTSAGENSVCNGQFHALEFSMTCSGTRSSSNISIYENDGGDGSKSANPCRRRFKRTRGHLPEPNVLTDEGEAVLLIFQVGSRNLRNSLKDVDFATEIATEKEPEAGESTHEMEIRRSSLASQIGLAMRFESMNADNTQMNFITSLDLESARLITDSGTMNIHQSKVKTLPIKRSIEVVDLSSLCHLKRLSVRGCSGLITLRLPACLMALDASACTKLKELSFSDCISIAHHANASSAIERDQIFASDGDSCDLNLEALNLNGCRSLVSTQFLSFALKNVKELDMTSVSSMSRPLIADAMKAAQKLKSISLRYIATDDMIDSLAASDAAAEICLMDVAFSHVTDGAMETLLRRTVRLERCNLRGCKMISGYCYNQVPIYLSRRFGADGVSNQFKVQYDDGDERRKRRKGDNIFHFVN